MVAAVFVRELEDGQAVDLTLLIRDAEVRTASNGEDYLRLQLADRSGSVPAVLFGCPPDTARVAVPGVVVRVTGRYAVHARYGPQIRLNQLRVARPDEYALEQLLDGPAHEPAQMESDLRDLIATVQNPHLRGLLDRLLGEGSEVWRAYQVAPAAKYYHQAYRHGLLEHSLTVAQAVSTISATFAGLDRDVAISG